MPPVSVFVVQSGHGDSGARSQLELAQPVLAAKQIAFTFLEGKPWRAVAEACIAQTPQIIHTLDNAALRQVHVLQQFRRIPRVPLVAAGVRGIEPGLVGMHTRRALRSAEMVCATAPSDLAELAGITKKLVKWKPGVAEVPVQQSKAELAREANIPVDSRWIVSMGRFDSDDGFRQAAWAFDVLKYEARDLHLVLIGQGPKRAEVERFSKALGSSDHRVSFIGHRANVNDWLHAAELVWVTRSRGGVSAILEAQAAGKPIVGMNSADVSALIENERTGVLSPMNEPVELARATAQLLKEPERMTRLAAAGHQRVLEQFPIQAVAEQLALGYDEILANARSLSPG